MDEAASMKWSLDGAQMTGKEAAKGNDQGMGAAIARYQVLGGSDNGGVASYGVLSRVNSWLSRHCKSEQESVAWLMSLLVGLSMPKSSARTNEDMENTSELSNVRFRECEVDEEICF